MKLKDSFNRLRFTLSNQNKPNETDIEAFNKICQVFEKQQKETVNDHFLFAKLYTHILSELCIHYTSIDVANEEVNKLLSKPLSYHIEMLSMRLQTMEYQNYFHSKRVLDPLLKTKTAKELEELHNLHKDNIKELSVDEFFRCGQRWTEKEIIYNLESNINLAIQKYKDNV